MTLFSLLRRRKQRKLEDLPPYSTVPQQGQPEAKVNEVPSTTLLDPNFTLSGPTIEEQLGIRNRTFARAIVQFVGERLDGNLTGKDGYRYTYSRQFDDPPSKECSWDGILGFNAWGYRGRFKYVDALVKRDFEERGFLVRKCHVYDSAFGDFVEWSLAIKNSREK